MSDLTTSMIIVTCPHCNQCIEVVETNCCIFRCGVYIRNFNQIDPHMSKPECEKLVRENAIYGCGKPFLIKKQSDSKTYISEICDYI